jgi:hypothetical protein
MYISLLVQGMMGTPPQHSAVVSKSEEDYFSEILASAVYGSPNINFNF